VDLQYADNGTTAVIHLSGLIAQDAQLVGKISTLNTVFGAGTTNAADSSTGGGTATSVPVSGTGSTDASTGNLQFDIAAGAYTYTINNFANGDVLHFPTGNTTLDNGTLGNDTVNVLYDNGATVTTIVLTGLTPAQDAGLFNSDVNLLNTVIGAGTIV
jgi:hypothetical protein